MKKYHTSLSISFMAFPEYQFTMFQMHSCSFVVWEPDAFLQVSSSVLRISYFPSPKNTIYHCEKATVNSSEESSQADLVNCVNMLELCRTHEHILNCVHEIHDDKWHILSDLSMFMPCCDPSIRNQLTKMELAHWPSLKTSSSISSQSFMESVFLLVIKISYSLC